MSDSPAPQFTLDPSLLEPSTSTSLALGAQEAIAHVAELTDMEVALDEGAVAVAAGAGKEGAVEAVDGTAQQPFPQAPQANEEAIEDEGGYSPSQPQGRELSIEVPDDPYAVTQDEIEKPDDDLSTAGYSPSAPQGQSHPLPTISTTANINSSSNKATTASALNAQSDTDAEAEGEIDMDLAGDEGDESEREGDTGVGMVVDPALLGLTGISADVEASSSGMGQGSSSVPSTNFPQDNDATDTQTQNQNQTFRRPPNARRQSPTYSMPEESQPQPSSIGSGIPARPVPSPSQGPSTQGQGRTRTSISSPIKPTTLPQTSASNNSGQAGRQDYQQKFDLENFDFPKGLDTECGGARKHPVLVDGLGRAKSKKSPALISQALHALFEAARTDGDVEEARIWFAEFESLNPTATGPLLKLINLELEHGNFPQVVGLYEKALRGLGGSVGAVPGVGIWTSYLHYIRRQNPIPPPTPTNAAAAEVVRQTVKSAYELALKECGNDISAGPIWQEYIGFLGEKENTNAWEIQQQVDAIRKVYQRAVVVPMYEVEAIWREYDAFENKQNKMTAKKFLAERSPLYMTARTALRDLRGHLENLVPLDVPPRPTWTQSDRDLVIAWRKYLKWEETNPLDIDDPSALQSRVLYGMKKCLTQMRFFPELWYHTSTYASAQGKPEEAAAYLKNGLEANPTSFLLTFAYAEHEEGQKNFAVVKTTFESLIKHHGVQIDKLKASIAEEAEAAKGPEVEGDVKVSQEDIDMDGAEPTQARRRYLEREARGTAVTERRAKELEELMSAAGVVWIMYMRFARRAEGLKLARSVFTQARKSSYVSWQVFEASAYMEYHCNKDASVATKIFELGLKAFPEEVAFAVKFLQFQLQINDDSNARALFERLALKFPPEKARPIWDTWARYEYLYSDLSACQKLEARFAEAYPADAPLKRFAARYNYLGLDEIAIRDLGFGLRTQAPAPPPPAVKRPLPDESPSRSPRPEPRYRDDRGPPMRNEPPTKRSRPISRDREPPRRAMPPNDNGYHGGGRREASPPSRRLPERLPPGPPPTSDPLDRSGLPISIVRFLGNLPSARTFDGPIFRADDLMNVLRDARIPGAMSRQGDYRGPPPVGRPRF